MKKTLLAMALASLAMSACSPKEEQRQEKEKAVAVSNCQNPIVVDDVRQKFERAIQQETANFVLNDSRDWIDADKVATAVAQLKFGLNGVQEKNGQCSGKLSITIPRPVLRTAQTNAPLLSMDNPNTVIEQRMADGNFQYNEGVLSIPLAFSVSGKGQKADVQYHDDGLNVSGIAVAAALLPYGVKENIVVNGRSVSREAALQALQLVAKPAPSIAPPPSPNPPTHTDTPPAPQPVTETPEQKALREARVAEAKAKAEAERAALRAAKAKAAREAAEAKKLAEAKKAEAAKANDAKPADTAKPAENKPADAPTSKPAEKPADKPATAVEATPPVTVPPPAVKEEPKPQPRVSDEELDKVRQAHSKADQEIKSSWKKISPEIQKELVEEQKTWERQRNQKCRQVAAGGGDESESNKLYMQCDTRMTKERVKNLEGYSISD